MNPSIHADRSIGSIQRAGRGMTGFLLGIVLLLVALSPLVAVAQAPTTTSSPTAGLPPLTLNIGMDGIGQPKDVDVAIQVLFAITLLSMAPSIVLLMTCFSRIVIVLSFVRNALTLQGAPANK